MEEYDQTTIPSKETSSMQSNQRCDPIAVEKTQPTQCEPMHMTAVARNRSGSTKVHRAAMTRGWSAESTKKVIGGVFAGSSSLLCADFWSASRKDGGAAPPRAAALGELARREDRAREALRPRVGVARRRDAEAAFFPLALCSTPAAKPCARSAAAATVQTNSLRLRADQARAGSGVWWGTHEGGMMAGSVSTALYTKNAWLASWIANRSQSGSALG